MGVFDFIKDTGSKILKGTKDEKMAEAQAKVEAAKAAEEAKNQVNAPEESGGFAAKARAAAEKAKEAALEARDKAAEQAKEAKEKATELKEAAAKKQAEAREAFLERRAEARKADELEDYLDGLGMGKDIDVRFDDGTVYLEGKVADQAELERVVLAVGNVEGVEKVDEHLEVEEPADAARMYTVKSGDTLSAIAKEFYGDANRYNEIFEANRPMLTDPNLIYPGQVLRIP